MTDSKHQKRDLPKVRRAWAHGDKLLGHLPSRTIGIDGVGGDSRGTAGKGTLLTKYMDRGEENWGSPNTGLDGARLTTWDSQETDTGCISPAPQTVHTRHRVNEAAGLTALGMASMEAGAGNRPAGFERGWWAVGIQGGASNQKLSRRGPTWQLPLLDHLLQIIARVSQSCPCGHSGLSGVRSLAVLRGRLVACFLR